jgi:hypothetical protein
MKPAAGELFLDLLFHVQGQGDIHDCFPINLTLSYFMPRWTTAYLSQRVIAEPDIA